MTTAETLIGVGGLITSAATLWLNYARHRREIAQGKPPLSTGNLPRWFRRNWSLPAMAILAASVWIQFVWASGYASGQTDIKNIEAVVHGWMLDRGYRVQKLKSEKGIFHYTVVIDAAGGRLVNVVRERAIDPFLTLSGAMIAEGERLSLLNRLGEVERRRTRRELQRGFALLKMESAIDVNLVKIAMTRRLAIRPDLSELEFVNALMDVYYAMTYANTELEDAFETIVADNSATQAPK